MFHLIMYGHKKEGTYQGYDKWGFSIYSDNCEKCEKILDGNG